MRCGRVRRGGRRSGGRRRGSLRSGRGSPPDRQDRLASPPATYDVRVHALRRRKPKDVRRSHRGLEKADSTAQRRAGRRRQAHARPRLGCLRGGHRVRGVEGRAPVRVRVEKGVPTVQGNGSGVEDARPRPSHVQDALVEHQPPRFDGAARRAHRGRRSMGFLINAHGRTFPSCTTRKSAPSTGRRSRCSIGTGSGLPSPCTTGTGRTARPCSGRLPPPPARCGDGGKRGCTFRTPPPAPGREAMLTTSKKKGMAPRAASPLGR